MVTWRIPQERGKPEQSSGLILIYAWELRDVEIPAQNWSFLLVKYITERDEHQ